MILSFKKRVGWWEWVSLPETDLPPFKAKVDSGAEVSSLHASDIDVYKKEDASWVKFTLHGDDNTTAACDFPVAYMRKIKSSNGIEQVRYAIKMNITIGNNTYNTNFTLAERSKMNFRSLLGKKGLLADYFLIESDQEAVQGKPKV